MMRVLLNSGALIDAGDHQDWTALFYACQDGHLASIQFLLEHGASIRARSKRGVTCLMVAIQTENVEIIRCLLDQGAEVNAREENDYTALHYCAQNSYPNAARILLAYGACVDVRDKVRDGALPLTFREMMDVVAEWNDAFAHCINRCQRGHDACAAQSWSQCYFTELRRSLPDVVRHCHTEL